MAGDGVSWTPGWVEGAVQTALNAVWGIMHHFGGKLAGMISIGDIVKFRIEAIEREAEEMKTYIASAG